MLKTYQIVIRKWDRGIKESIEIIKEMRINREKKERAKEDRNLNEIEKKIEDILTNNWEIAGNKSWKNTEKSQEEKLKNKEKSQEKKAGKYGEISGKKAAKYGEISRKKTEK